jgi:hypothetical protein
MSDVLQHLQHYRTCFRSTDNPKSNTVGIMDSSSKSYTNKELAAATQRRERLFRLRNQLAQNASDVEIIREYVYFFLETVDTESVADSLDTLERLEVFLLERSSDVNPEDVDALLELADDLDSRRQKLADEYEKQTSVSTEDEELLSTLNAWRENGPDLSIPADSDELESRYNLCRNVRALIQSRGEPKLEGLAEYMERLKSVMEADELIARIDSLIEAAKEEANASEAAYILQSAEQYVQQLVMKRFQSQEREKAIKQTVQEIEDAAIELAKRKRQAADDRLWERFFSEHAGSIKEAKSLSPNDISTKFKAGKTRLEVDEPKKRARLAKTDKEPKKNVVTQKIEALQTLYQSLNQVASQVKEEEYLLKVIELVDEIETKLQKLQVRRQQLYNEFALARIRAALLESEKALGWTINDKEGIANAMGTYLAEIDESVLTREVSRCYSEVFEHLYGKLKKAKGSDDFEEEGRKLNVLKRMHNTDKISIDKF